MRELQADSTAKIKQTELALKDLTSKNKELNEQVQDKIIELKASKL